MGVVLGVVLGGILHVSVQIPALVSAGLLPRFDIRANFALVKDIILVSFPRMLTLSTNHISMLFLVAFASLMTIGSISVFNFSFNLQSVPLSIIGVSYSMAAFPTLSRLFGSGDRTAFIDEIVNAGRHIIFWSMPVAMLFIVLRAQIVRTVLGSGNFSWSDTRLTAAAFALFAVSALAQSLILLFIRGYYSASFTKKPLTINVVSAVITVVITFLLIKIFGASLFFRDFVESLLRVEDIPGTVVLMLPLGFSIGQIVNAILHWVYFEKDFAAVHTRLFKTFFETSGAALIMGYVAYNLLGVFDNFFNLDTLLGIFLQGFCAGIVGIIAGVVVLILLKNQELQEVWQALHEKIWRAKAIVPAQENL
jgi:putative peptidoglycan lipid II flippase